MQLLPSSHHSIGRHNNIPSKQCCSVSILRRSPRSYGCFARSKNDNQTTLLIPTSAIDGVSATVGARVGGFVSKAVGARVKAAGSHITKTRRNRVKDRAKTTFHCQPIFHFSERSYGCFAGSKN